MRHQLKKITFQFFAILLLIFTVGLFGVKNTYASPSTHLNLMIANQYSSSWSLKFVPGTELFDFRAPYMNGYPTNKFLTDIDWSNDWMQITMNIIDLHPWVFSWGMRNEFQHGDEFYPTVESPILQTDYQAWVLYKCTLNCVPLNYQWGYWINNAQWTPIKAYNGNHSYPTSDWSLETDSSVYYILAPNPNQ